MKAYLYLAKKHASQWLNPPASEEVQDELAKSYQAGFIAARDMAAGLCEDLKVGPDKFPDMVRAIGTASVNPETGERLDS